MEKINVPQERIELSHPSAFVSKTNLATNYNIGAYICTPGGSRSHKPEGKRV